MFEVVYQTAFHKCVETKYQILAVVILNLSLVKMLAVCLMFMPEHRMVTSKIAIPTFGAEKMHEIRKIISQRSLRHHSDRLNDKCCQLNSKLLVGVSRTKLFVNTLLRR